MFQPYKVQVLFISNSWICLLGGPEDDLIRSKHVALTKYTIFFYINTVLCYRLTCIYKRGIS